MLRLAFVSGTLEIKGADEGTVLPGATFDPRTQCLRAPAHAYAAIVRALHAAGLSHEDGARQYEALPLEPHVHRDPRPYQREALDAWQRARGQGIVVLPTGAGKSHVAMMAIAAKQRSSLIVAPTLDLVRQWFELLGATFATEVGIIGGGEYTVRPLTVTTYDSAHLHMEHLGARFGLVVWDECHHLPSPAYALAARACLAPFRLGLTATPERTDGRDGILDDLVGPCVYRKEIVELSGEYLAEYDTEYITVDLLPDEREEYEAARKVYRDFVSYHHISMRSPTGWSDFIRLSARNAEGRAAMAAYRRQRTLSFAARGKLDYVEHLLAQHRRDRAIIFTQDNATCYGISRRFLVPAITHQTKVRERSDILSGLRAGVFSAVVTSKVLNEGVDVPEANVAIVLSGSGSVREHVQRLGRVLRKKADKRAILYELVTAGTSEVMTSDRRREHSAYR